MTPQDEIDSLTTDILATLRTRTESPREAIQVCGLCIYMLWAMNKSDSDFRGFMKDFSESMASLHFANDIKGTA